jgi:hypothetical protein
LKKFCGALKMFLACLQILGFDVGLEVIVKSARFRPMLIQIFENFKGGGRERVD